MNEEKKEILYYRSGKDTSILMQYKSLSELTGITPPSGYTPPRMMTKTRRYEVIKAICQKLKPLDRI